MSRVDPGAEQPLHQKRPSLSAAVRARLADFCLIADLAAVDLLISDADSGYFLECNRSAHIRLGYSKGELLALSPEAIQADPDHDGAWVAARRRELIANGGGIFHTSHRCRDNSILEVEVSHQLLRLDGQLLILTVVRDEQQVRTREQTLTSELELVDAGEAFSGVGSWEVRFADGRMRCSKQMRRLCRHGSQQGPESLWSYGSLIHPRDRTLWRHDLQRAINRGELLSSRHRLLQVDGSERVVQAEAKICYDDSGEALYAIGILRDVSDEQSLLQAYEADRHRDPLTSLPNKIAATEELENRLNGRSYNTSLAIISIDIDGFQEINDTYGSEVGDQVLRAMGQRLQELLPPQAWLARVSSDGFLVLLEEHIHSIGDGLKACRQLQQKWGQQERLLAQLPVFPTFCMGLATYPEHGQTARGLIQCANTALTKARSEGRQQIRAYSSTISRQIQERMHLGSSLIQAMSRDQLRLVVQSQVDRNSLLVGGEVLLRWTNHQGVNVSPSHFIPLAEESGMILQLGEWVFEHVLQQLACWRQAGLAVPRLALNVSPRELERPGRQFVSYLLDGLAAHNLNPEQLELEITETSLLRNPLACREQLRALADQGFRIAIDDFGTGYSSLDLLRNLPVHRLKIDRTFVQGLSASSGDRTIVKTTITLAHGLGMDCIAEGVETEEQYAILRDLGCDVFQGYLCGRPLELDAFGALLRQSQADGTMGRPPVISLRSHAVPVQHGLQGTASQGIPSTFEQLNLLRSAFDITDDYFLLLQSICSHDGSIVDFLILEINQPGCAYLQQEREAIVGQTMLAVFPQMEDNGLLDLYIDAAMRNNPISINDFSYRDHDLFKDDRVYDIQILPTRGYLVVTWRDVTERNHAARSLADTAALFRLLTDNIVEVVTLLNVQQDVVWVSPSLQPMTGWQSEQWRGRQFSDLFACGDGPPEPVDLEAWLQSHGAIRQGRLRLAAPEGGWIWVNLSVRRVHGEGMRDRDTGVEEAALPDDLHLHEGYVITLQPVDQQVEEERRLLRRATTDSLTGLSSRAAILQRLQLYLKDQKMRLAQPLALLFCDLDRFKEINDTYGHACGDVVLKAVATRIKSTIRDSDLAGRIGGDEFLVLLDGVETLETALAIAEQLRQAVAQPLQWGSTTLHPALSIGVALHGAGEDASLFLKRADRNMYAAKAAGRHQVVAL